MPLFKNLLDPNVQIFFHFHDVFPNAFLDLTVALLFPLLPQIMNLHLTLSPLMLLNYLLSLFLQFSFIPINLITEISTHQAVEIK